MIRAKRETNESPKRRPAPAAQTAPKYHPSSFYIDNPRRTTVNINSQQQHERLVQPTNPSFTNGTSNNTISSTFTFPDILLTGKRRLRFETYANGTLDRYYVNKEGRRIMDIKQIQSDSTAPITLNKNAVSHSAAKHPDREVIDAEIMSSPNVNSFRRTGRVVFGNSYAHVVIKIKMSDLEQELDAACQCASRPLTDFDFVNVGEGSDRTLANKINHLRNASISSCSHLKEQFTVMAKLFHPISHSTDAEVPETVNHPVEVLPNVFLDDSMDQKNAKQYQQRAVNTTSHPVRRLVHEMNTYCREQRQFVALGILVFSSIWSAFAGYEVAKAVDGNVHDDGRVEYMKTQNERINKLERLAEQNRITEKILQAQEKYGTKFDDFILYYETCELTITEHLSQVSRVTDGLADALNGRLSPNIITPEHLQHVIDKIRSRSDKLDYETALSHVSEAYQIPVSTIIQEIDGEVEVGVVIQIPMVRPESVMNLFQYIPTIQMTMYGSGEFQIFERISENPFLARGINSDFFRELKSEELMLCDKYGKLFLCPEISLIETNEQFSCLQGLYNDNHDLITAQCTSRLLNKLTTHAQQLDTSHYQYYTPTDERVWIHCPRGVRSKGTRKSIKGLYVFVVPPGCTADTEDYRFFSFSNLGYEEEYVHIDTQWNLTAHLNALSSSDIDHIVSQINEEGKKRIETSNIEKGIGFPIYQTPRRHSASNVYAPPPSTQTTDTTTTTTATPVVTTSSPSTTTSGNEGPHLLSSPTSSS